LGVRIDSAVYQGYAIPPYYDSLLAKLIVHGHDRADALSRLRRALDRCRITGVATNLAIHAELVADGEFARGGVDTAWFPRFLAGRASPTP